jgi:RNA polymerase sigma-70 factor (ECF subfamily)
MTEPAAAADESDPAAASPRCRLDRDVTRGGRRWRQSGVPMVADSLEAAYLRHAAELMRFATAIAGPDDASDVVTDAMLRVFHGRVDQAKIADVRAYLFRAVHRRLLDHERANARRRRRDLAFGHGTGHLPNDDARAAAIDARAALAALSAQQRTVVFLTYWCDHTPDDIARVLDVSEGTVRKQLARARARLREVLDD